MIDGKDISTEAINFFSSLLSRDPHLSEEDQRNIVSSIPQLIQTPHNVMMQAIPNMLEVKQALFSLPIDKAQGPDGFPTFFFQVYWEMVKQDVVKAMKEFFGAQNLLKEINSTFLVHIPKTYGVDSLDQFKPISLYNSFYKIISKVLMTRILRVLPLIISPQQMGFVPGRQILDSIMLVHEVIHSLEVGEWEGFLIKLDLSKAYTRVD